MRRGDVFDAVKRSKGSIWFLIVANFLYFVQFYQMVDGYHLVVTPKPRLHRAKAAVSSWMEWLLMPTSAEAAVLPDAVELLSVTDTPDPFSPNADGTKDTGIIQAEFSVDATKVREFDSQTAPETHSGGLAHQYFVDWQCKILSISDSSLVRRLSGREPLPPDDILAASTTLLVPVSIVWDGRPADSDVASEGTHDYRVQGFLVSDIDAEPPRMTVTAPFEGQCISTPDFRVTGFFNERGHVIINGLETIPVRSANGFAFASEPIALPEGRHTLTVQALDVFGNGATTALAVDVDRTAPTVRWVSPEPNAILPSRATVVQAEITDNLCGIDTGALILLVNDGAASAEAITFVDSIFTARIPLREGLLVGANRIELRVADRGDNLATARADVTVEPPVSIPPAGGGVVLGRVLDAPPACPSAAPAPRWTERRAVCSPTSPGSFALCCRTPDRVRSVSRRPA